VPISLPEHPRFASTSERHVYQALIDQLQDGDVVVAGQRVTDHLKDHEIDFVVAIEGAGIICIEVKGGEVWHNGSGWRQLRGGREYRIEPVRQAREACYALRDYIEHDPRWTQDRPRWDHVVALPHTKLPPTEEVGPRQGEPMVVIANHACCYHRRCEAAPSPDPRGTAPTAGGPRGARRSQRQCAGHGDTRCGGRGRFR
jgi:hypothetical protein